MKKNVLLKIVFITLILFEIVLSIYEVQAVETWYYNPGYLGRTEAKTLFDMGDSILGILLNIATIVSILTIAIIGVKYMFGSVEQKAEYKSSLLPWLIGAIVVFSITRILEVIQALAKTI